MVPPIAAPLPARAPIDVLPGAQPPDAALAEVEEYLLSIPSFSETCARAMRTAFDEVLDGARTGRYDIRTLEKVEKTYIGTKVEIVLRDKLGLASGKKLDLLIDTHEVDVKFSISFGGWMIPREAVSEICMLAHASDLTSTFSVGLVRATSDLLNLGQNQDRKRSLSSAGRAAIKWLIRDGQLRENVLLHLPPSIRDNILASAKSPTERVAELFRLVQLRSIPRATIETVARQKDPTKRIRRNGGAKDLLDSEGIQVLCGAWVNERSLASERGVTLATRDEWASAPV